MPLFSDAVASFRSRGTPQPSESAWLNWFTSTTEGSIELTDGYTASYAAIYREQPWVYAGVNALAKSMMRMPLKAYTRGDNNARERLTDGDLATLLRRPYAGGAQSKFMERIVKNVAIYGNAFVVKLGMSGEGSTPNELFPAPSIGWSRGENESYIWTSEKGVPHTFQRWQVMHYTFWDLDECGFGMSMLEPLRSTLAVENAARRFAVAAFKNGARPANVLKSDQKLHKDTAEALRANMERLHGGPDNAFKTAVLEQGLDFAPWPSHDLEEAALINHRQLTQEEVAAVLNVPQPSMGILRNANFASIDILHTAMYQDSCGPWAVMIEDTTQTDLVDATTAFEGQFVEIDMNGVMRGDLLSRVRAYATMLTSGQKTANEVRALENDPPSDQPEASKLLFPTNLSGAVGAQQSEDSGQEDDTDA